MGKASTRKKERRKIGMNQTDLKRMRGILELGKAMGGMIKFARGSDGELIHYAIIEVANPPVALCQTLSPLSSTNEAEVTCPVCSQIPARKIQSVIYETKAQNEAMIDMYERALKALGA